MAAQVTLQTDTDRILIPRDEAVELLDISHPTLYRWERQGLVRLVRIGRRTYLPVSELNRLTAGGEVVR